MLSRSFNIGSISDITNSLGDKISSLSGKATSLTKVTNIKEAQNLLASSANKSSKNTMNNETADILSKVCDSKGINIYSDDYIKNLERALGIKDGMSLCDESNVSEIDRVLMMSTLMNSSQKAGYKTMINKMIGGELNTLGYNGSIPSCLYGKVESLIDSLLSGINGNINLKLDLMKLFNNKCMNETVGAFSNSNLSTKLGSLMTDNMMTSGDTPSAVKYLGGKYNEDPNSALGILGNSMSSVNNADGTTSKLMMYSAMDNNYGGLNTTMLNKNNIASNLNDDLTINKNSKGLMDSLGSVFSTNDSSLFGGKSNLNNSASSYIANSKSSDSLGSTTKSSNMNLASTIKLANLFG